MSNSLDIPWETIVHLASPWAASISRENDHLIVKHTKDDATAKTVVSVQANEGASGIGGRIEGVLLVETMLSWPDAPGAEAFAAMINSKAALGAAVPEPDGQLRLFSRLTLFEDEVEAWRILAPLVALSACTNIQVLANAVADATETQRGWPEWPDKESAWTERDLTDVANRLNAMEIVSFGDEHGLSAEIPWEEGAISAAAGLLGEKPHVTTLLQMSTETPHPLLGAGLLCTLQLPLPSTDAPLLVTYLNTMERTQSDAPPSFGAWCTSPSGGQPTYVCFLPNLLHSLRIEHNIAIWMSVRSRLARTWLKDALE